MKKYTATLISVTFLLVFPTSLNGQGIVTRESSNDVSNKDKLVHQETKRRYSQGMSQNKQNQIIANIESNMVFVKGGTFQMGTNDLMNSTPAHQVEVDDYYIGKYEITQEEWYAVTGKKIQTSWDKKSSPVILFDWADLEKFIRILNEKTNKSYRLPTEAEWEWAAQGGNQSCHYKYSGSNDAHEVVSCGYESVGTKKPNELGLYDMSGNVSEFCSDFYSTFSSKYQINPSGPSINDVKPSEYGYYHVIKGGAWPPIQYAPSKMYEYRPQFRDKAIGSGNSIGFRLALDAIPNDLSNGLAQTYIEAKRGKSNAMRTIANHYFQMGNNELYIKWLERMGAISDFDAYMQLGEIYKDGTMVQKDLFKSEKYLSLAYNTGNKSAKKALGEVRNEIGLLLDKTNAKEALSWFEKGAELGNADSQNNAGLYYWHGKGVAVDYNKAANYFLLSANQNHYHALNNIATAYLNGMGVKKDLAKAEYWYRKAAENGHPDAKQKLEQIGEKMVTIVASNDNEPLIGCLLKFYRGNKELFIRVSDINGQYLIRDVRKGDVLRFEYVGYKSKEVTLNYSQTPQTLTFSLSPGSNKKTEYETKY